MFIRHTAFST